MNAVPWLDRTLYPFEHHYVDVDGGRMHYVDEGDGPVVLFVHGTPTWSFLFRNLIRALSDEYRVIAPDHIGFGLSAKPVEWSGRPADHQRNLGTLVERLGLEDVTLVVHDFGGPIGLGWAVDHPERVRAVVLFNTWLWSLQGSAPGKLGSLLGGRFGRWLYRSFNLSPRFLVPLAFHDRRRLDPAVHRHYMSPFPVPDDRRGPWVLARELLGSTTWYEERFSRIGSLRDKPGLLIWGMKDAAFGRDALARWKQALPSSQAIELEDVGHFAMEEAPDATGHALRLFLAGLPNVGGARAAGTEPTTAVESARSRSSIS